MVMPMCSSGPPQSFFTGNCPFNENSALAFCEAYFGKRGYTREMFRPNWALINYGAQFPAASNIVFSNGYLDPWSGGGWKLEPFTEGSLVSLIVEDGAHHYDLRVCQDLLFNFMSNSI
jgi:lysosomal Pro-X carboxypeptidase